VAGAADRAARVAVWWFGGACYAAARDGGAVPPLDELSRVPPADVPELAL
jgi:hypothetical protein